MNLLLQLIQDSFVLFQILVNFVNSFTESSCFLTSLHFVTELYVFQRKNPMVVKGRGRILLDFLQFSSLVTFIDSFIHESGPSDRQNT